MAFDIHGFEDRHPMIRSLLRSVTVDNIDHASAVALRVEDACKQLAVALPDGPVLQELLQGLQDLQTRAVSAVHAVFAPSDVNGVGSVGDPGRGAGLVSDAVPMDLTPGTPAPGLTVVPAESAAPVPGRDHPITWTGPTDPGPVVLDQAPAPGVPAEVPEAPEDAPTAPVGDSGPLGAVHATTEATAVS